MGLILAALAAAIIYNVVYGVYAVKRSDGGDVCYAVLLILVLLLSLFIVAGLLRARG